MKQKIMLLILGILIGFAYLGYNTAPFQALLYNTSTNKVIRVTNHEFVWPTAAKFINDKLFVTEKRGRLFMIFNNEKINITNMPEVFSAGSGGLLDAIFWEEDKRIHVVFAMTVKNNDQLEIKIIEGTINNTLFLENKVHYTADISNTTNIGASLLKEEKGFSVAFGNNSFEDSGKFLRFKDDSVERIPLNLTNPLGMSYFNGNVLIREQKDNGAHLIGLNSRSVFMVLPTLTDGRLNSDLFLIENSNNSIIKITLLGVTTYLDSIPNRAALFVKAENSCYYILEDSFKGRLLKAGPIDEC